jgi:hypothetical protein
MKNEKVSTEKVNIEKVNIEKVNTEKVSTENNNIKKIMTPEDYINIQSLDRQIALKELRQTILNNLPSGFKEVIQYGMIGYVVPHEIYPDGYHVNPKEPLPFLGLANQKGFIAIYHMGIYADKLLMEWFVKAYEELNIGKLDMGKSCIRLRKFNKIPTELIGELCKKMSVEDYISIYEKNKGRKQ